MRRDCFPWLFSLSPSCFRYDRAGSIEGAQIWSQPQPDCRIASVPDVTATARREAELVLDDVTVAPHCQQFSIDELLLAAGLVILGESLDDVALLTVVPAKSETGIMDTPKNPRCVLLEFLLKWSRNAYMQTSTRILCFKPSRFTTNSHCFSLFCAVCGYTKCSCKPIKCYSKIQWIILTFITIRIIWEEENRRNLRVYSINEPKIFNYI